MSASACSRKASCGRRGAMSLPAEAAARMPAAPQIRPLDVVKAAARKAELDQLGPGHPGQVGAP